MKPAPILLLLASPLLFSSCASTPTATSGFTNHGELSQLYERPPIRFSRATVSCTILEPEAASVKLPTLNLRYGRIGRVSETREFASPTEYSFPELPKSSTLEPSDLSSFPVTPSTPSRFKKTDLGWTLKVNATRRGGFVMIKGELVQKRVGDAVGATGKPFSPIVTKAKDMFGRDVDVVLTENRTGRPIIETREVPVMIAALPGETYKISVGGGSFAEFRVEVK